MATKTEHLEVHPSKVDGWDVKHAGDADAISNFAERDAAIEAAEKIAEHEDADADVVVSDEPSGGGDEGRGVKFYFVVLLGLLALVTLIIVIVSVIGGSTEFGADDANMGEGTILSPLLTLLGV